MINKKKTTRRDIRATKEATPECSGHVNGGAVGAAFGPRLLL